MRTFSVKNFEKFQHYKDRAPPWIKLYNELLDDYDFACLQDASKMHLIAIWLLASRSENKIPYDPKWIAKRINATNAVDLEALVQAGFIVVNQELQNVEQVASNALAECLSRDRGEEETEKSIRAASQPASDGWEKFKKTFPRRQGSHNWAQARKLFESALKKGAAEEEIIAGAANFARLEAANVGTQYIPQAVKWLRHECWKDQESPAVLFKSNDYTEYLS